jgi:hypothetical protein
MTGYSKASSASAIATTDSLNTAIGKLEKALDGKGTSNLALGTTSTTAAKGDHTHDDRYYTESEIDTKLAAKSDTGHTHNYAGSSSAGGPANSVKASLTFNNSGSGVASGITFDGSTARTISYNTVGAAAASHTHTKSQITDFAHNHDDRYYTEGESDARFAPISHAHGNIANGGTLSAASMVVVTDANKKITTSSTISTTELGYLDGVTSNIQTQLNGKSATGHTHDDRYYTESESDSRFSPIGHTHNYLEKTTYEWNKEFAAGQNGAISLGRYNMYDSQITFDITSTTTQTISGKLVIATQNGSICQAKVFGDAENVLAPRLQIYQSAITNGRSWIEVFCNFDG